MLIKRLYVPLRDLHLYAGLFFAPFIVVFAVSTIVLNHPSREPQTGGTAAKRTMAITVPEGAGTLEQAKDILRQTGVSGEIDYLRSNAKAGRLLIPVSKPGETTLVEVDVRQNTATVESQRRGLSHALSFLHKMPGPHNAAIRGNWTFIAWWRVVADAVVYGIMFITLTGLYLWWFFKAERTIGWALLGAGAGSVAVLVVALTAA
jgi:hypothetical protein